MWQIFKAEMRYKKYSFFILFLLTPFVVYYDILRAETGFRMFDPTFMKLWLIVVFAQLWIVYRNKNNREEWLCALPVTPIKIATIRYLMILAYGLGFYLLTLSQFSIIGQFELFDFKSMIVSLGIQLFIFSLYFIGRDLLANFFVRIGWTKERVLPFFLMLTLVINLLTILLFLQAKQKKGALLNIGRAIDYVIENNPFVGEYGLERFIGLVLIFIIGSLIAFCRQKSFIKNRTLLNKRA